MRLHFSSSKVGWFHKEWPLMDPTLHYASPNFNDYEGKTSGLHSKPMYCKSLIWLELGKLQKSSSINLNIKWQPGFVLMANWSKFLFPIEVKTKWVLSEDNIVEIYNNTKPPTYIAYLIMQIFGYMSNNEVQYGVLPTYDKSRFLRRQKQPWWVLDFRRCDD